MTRRFTFTAIAMVVCTAVLAPAVATANVRNARPAKFCATVDAGLPRHAAVGDTIEIDSGMANCDTRRARLMFVYRFDGPCHSRDHSRHRYTLDPGEGFGSAALFVVPCAGRYRLLVEAYYGQSLLARKTRRMTATGS